MLIIKDLGVCEYQPILNNMQNFTQNRQPDTPDQWWFLEHLPTYTQGASGKPEHLLIQNSIPCVQSDRGGQITYHGPGQLIVYFLMDLKRRKTGLKNFIYHIEQAVIDLLFAFHIAGHRLEKAPGVYVNAQKICSLGLRIKKGCTYHGLSLNVNMDLSPFLNIHPCGFKNLAMVQTKDLNGPSCIEQAKILLEKALRKQLAIPKETVYAH